MLHPLHFLFGYKRLRIGMSYAGELMNVCSRGGYIYRNFAFCGEHACLDASFRMAKKIISACADRGIPIIVDGEYGLPALLGRYRRRYGVFVGVLAFFAIVFFSGRVVWDIRIDGNSKVSDEQIKEELGACGLTIGNTVSKLDTAIIENRMLILSDEISWITINIKGTVAEVEVREVEPMPYEETYDAASLVAATDGQIEFFEDVRGNIAVKIGDVVSEGDLLVGGLYDVEGGGVRYTCAKGKVYARTRHTFLCDIPLKYREKVYTGRVKTEKYLIFFEKEIKFFENSGNSYGTCDTINTIEYFDLSADVVMPVGIRTVKHMEYEWRDALRSPESAMHLAYDQLRVKTESEVPDGALLRKQLSAELTDSAYILRCTADYIENIAVVKEIEIEGVFSKNQRQNGSLWSKE